MEEPSTRGRISCINIEGSNTHLERLYHYQIGNNEGTMSASQDSSEDSLKNITFILNDLEQLSNSTKASSKPAPTTRKVSFKEDQISDDLEAMRRK